MKKLSLLIAALGLSALASQAYADIEVNQLLVFIQS